MSRDTNIEWCDHTASPWYGCTKVSPGCTHCYAEGWANRSGRDIWGKGKPRQKSKSFGGQCRRWNNEDQYTAQYRTRVFPSLCDWLDGEVPIDWLSEFMQVIHDCPNVDFLLLTKRPDQFESRLRSAELWLVNGSRKADDPRVAVAMWISKWRHALDSNKADGDSAPPNVWIGVSVEDQERADDRIPHLLRIPSAVRFLSVEPLLSPVDLTNCCADESMGLTYNALTGKNWSESPLPKIDWVIVGGESGPKFRDCGVEAICDVAEQCNTVFVPCFVKQDAHRLPGQRGRIPDDVWALKQFPGSLIAHERLA